MVMTIWILSSLVGLSLTVNFILYVALKETYKKFDLFVNEVKKAKVTASRAVVIAGLCGLVAGFGLGKSKGPPKI